MLDDLMKIFSDAQASMGVTKEKLDGIIVTAESANGKIKIEANANRKITNLKIDEEWLKSVESEELEDFLTIALNRVLEEAENVNNAEMQSTASKLIPPGFAK
ncbi:MAG: YbaB/EbfC family nucleoid-associated protein [Bacteroidales bacterium]|nr:YbaB/EbfC family nucleoid-associated protein [Bacteroidales bacterium]